MVKLIKKEGKLRNIVVEGRRDWYKSKVRKLGEGNTENGHFPHESGEERPVAGVLRGQWPYKAM